MNSEKIYEFVNNEEDARVCKDIPDEACNYVPANFFLLIISNTFTKLGDALSNPKTVLTWIMTYVQAPVALIAFLVPVRESGSMLPQIFIASYIRRLQLRKWIWVAGSVLQFFSILSIGFISLYLTGALAGWLILGSLILFSLSRGLSSVASKDVIGKTIPKTRRGRLNGFSTSVSGLLVLGVGIFLLFKKDEDAGSAFYSGIIFVASVMWIAGALVYSKVRELPGETSGGGNAFSEAMERMKLVKTDKNFRNFLITRALLLCSALTAPFYVVLATDNHGSKVYILGLFILSNGIASTISAPVWGRLADRSSRKVLIIAAIITSSLGIVMFSLVSWVPSLSGRFWLYPVAYFILGIAHSGVRLGRKTYIIDMAGGNKRTDYVAVSNTIIGGILLITGGISALASLISPEAVILALSAFGLAGAFSGRLLPEVES